MIFLFLRIIFHECIKVKNKIDRFNLCFDLHIFTFTCWGRWYFTSPPWFYSALAFLTILALLYLIFSFYAMTPILIKSLPTSSSHLFLGHLALLTPLKRCKRIFLGALDSFIPSTYHWSLARFISVVIFVQTTPAALRLY